MSSSSQAKKPVQFSSIAQSCPTLCDLMNRSTPGLPVHHHFQESTQTPVHWVGEAIQPLSHPLSSPSPPAFNLAQHQGLFKWVSSSHQVAKNIGVSASASILPINTQDWFPLGWTGWISLQSKEAPKPSLKPFLVAFYYNQKKLFHMIFFEICLKDNNIIFFCKGSINSIALAYSIITMTTSSGLLVMLFKSSICSLKFFFCRLIIYW